MEFKNYPATSAEGQMAYVTIASGPVIIEDGKVLVDKHGDSDLWKFPGGAMHHNESPEDAAKREVQEELGIDVELKGEPFVVTLQLQKNNTPVTVVLLHYFAKRLTKDITPGRDVREWSWLDVNNLPADVSPNIAAVVEHFKHQIA